MALTIKTALSFYQLESADRTEWPNPINYTLEALSADDIEVCVINPSAAEGSQKLSLVKDTDYTLDFANNTVTCTSTNWSDVSDINNHSATQIRVFRSTSTTKLVDFTNGAVLNADELNLAYKQNLFAAQEMNEDAALTRGGVQSVSSSQLANSAVISKKIADSAVNQNKIANNAVSTAKIQDSAVNASKLATDAVETAKIQNSAVDVNKLASNAVTTVKILDDAVTYDKVAPATKAQMEGQSAAGIVTPDVLKNSPFSPRAYGVIQYDATGADALEAGSYNVDVTSTEAETNAAKTRKIYFDTDLSDTNYTVVTTVQGDAGTDGRHFIKEKNAGYFVIFSDDVTHDTNRKINFVVFGSTYPNP